GRTGSTRLSGQFAREEVLELEDTARRREILVAGGARHGRLVHAKLLSDLAQHHGTKGNVTIVEERLLARYDRLCDASNGRGALFQASHQPPGFLQCLCHERTLVVASVLEQLCI